MRQSLTRLPGFSEIASILPVLLLVGTSIQTAVVLATALFVMALIERRLSSNPSKIVIDPTSLFVIATMIAGLFATLGGYVIGLGWVFMLLLVGIVTTVKRPTVSNGATQRLVTLVESEREQTSRDLAIWTVIVLAALGWQSLWYYAFALVLWRFSWRLKKRWRIAKFCWLFVPIGYGLSKTAETTRGGQYWTSVDQLWRATVANSMPTWGINDFSGAVGSQLRYHWLSEASAGFLAKISSTTSVESVIKIAPVVGVVSAIVVARRIGAQLGFSSRVTNFAAAFTVILCREFELFSIGTLWGSILSLIGLSIVLQLVTGEVPTQSSQWAWGIIIVMTTILITMTQVTLGPHFLLVSIAAMFVGVFRRTVPIALAASVAGAQAVVILVLRQTLLANEVSEFYAPSISIRNVLQFRGIDIYVGENRFFVIGVSLLFLLVLSQKGAGLLTLAESKSVALRVYVAVGSVAFGSLTLSNLFSMGGFEAQQSRFLSPLVVVITLVSNLILTQRISDVLRIRQVNISLVGAVVASMLFASGLAFLNYRLYGAAWSLERTYGIALTVLITQVALVGLAFWQRLLERRGHATHLVALLLIAGVALAAHGRTTAYLVEYQTTADKPQRELEYTGDRGAQDCFMFIRNQTPRDTVIASNWFRLPTETRNKKNFMVSAWTERRTYIDGPEYVSYWTAGLNGAPEESPDWIELRDETSDEFAERATESSFETLKAASVDYFLIETIMPMPSSWEPYATTVLERASCKVLKLND